MAATSMSSSTTRDRSRSIPKNAKPKGRTLTGKPNNGMAPASTGKGTTVPASGRPTAGDPVIKDPSPVGRYNAVKNAFQTPGMQPGENEMIAKIMKNRGVDRKTARAIGARRTAKGLTTAGVSGPGGNPKAMGLGGGRKPVKNPKPVPGTPRPPSKPYTGPKPGKPKA